MLINDNARTQMYLKHFSLAALKETSQRSIRKISSKYCLRSYEAKLPTLFNDVYKKYIKPSASKIKKLTPSTISRCYNVHSLYTKKDFNNHHYYHNMRFTQPTTIQSSRLNSYNSMEKLMKIFSAKTTTRIIVKRIGSRALSLS
jgi:hypothetical protein